MTQERVPYQVTWRPLARDDLLAIVRYIARDDPVRAQSFGADLASKTNRLAQLPLSGRPGRVAGTRELVAHPNCIIYYRVDEAVAIVEVLRVKHVAQHFP